MKKFLITLFLVAMLLGLCSCTNPTPNTSSSPASTDVSTSETVEQDQSFQMELIKKCVIDSDCWFKYYRDTTTDVIYLWYREYQKGGLTMMSDPETGMPLTYTRYIEIYEQKE